MAREWDLNAKQRKAAELLAIGDPETFECYTRVQVAELVDISRSTLYEWLKLPEFNDYVEYIADMHIRSKIPEVDKRLIHAVLNERTNSKLLETFYKRTGKLKEVSKVEATIENAKGVSEQSTDELAAQLEALRKQARDE